MALVVVLPLLKGNDNALAKIQPSVLTAIILFFVGILASATMIIPGVSGSMVLMIIGYYYGILNGIKLFFDALKAVDINAILSQCAVLVPFGIGVIVGIFGVAKLINYLFNRHGVSTYCGIFGLILASPFAIIYQSGAYESISIISFVIGIFLMAACGAGAYFMSKITAE
jgi:putative membrane protein